MECYIIKPARSLLMKHLVIGQCLKAPDFSAFHWSPRRNLVSIGQHFVITKVVHLPKRTETSLISRSDSVIELVSDLITESDQAVRAMHSCNSWFRGIHWPNSMGKPRAHSERLPFLLISSNTKKP